MTYSCVLLPAHTCPSQAQRTHALWCLRLIYLVSVLPGIGRGEERGEGGADCSLLLLFPNYSTWLCNPDPGPQSRAQMAGLSAKNVSKMLVRQCWRDVISRAKLLRENEK